MHSIDNQLIFSATDLSHFLACPHLSLLSRRAALGGQKPPVYDDPGLEVLWQRGLQHEQQHLARFRDEGKRVLELTEPQEASTIRDRWIASAAATRDAMQSGADVIYQAALFDGRWIGKADFLIRVEQPSALGPWSYEVVDTKLAREAKGGALLQVLLYAELLAQVQGVLPEQVHIALGGPEPRTETFRVADYAAYFRSIKQRFLQLMQTAPPDIATAPDPVEHCDICAWSGVCGNERRDVDHLSLVAGITSNQRRVLRERGIERLESLATQKSNRMIEVTQRAIRIAGSQRECGSEPLPTSRAMSPTILRIEGFRFFFYSREPSGTGLEPPHVHVRKSGNEAKVWIDSLEIAYAHGFSPHELRTILALTQTYQNVFKEAWDDYFRSNPRSQAGDHED